MIISAKFDLNLPAHFLIKGSRETRSINWQFDIDGTKVEIDLLFDTSGSVRGQGESLHTFAAVQAHVTVSRKHENIPELRGSREWCDFFFKVQDEYSKAAKLALNNLIKYFKYRLGNPLLNELSTYEEHYFENPRWFDESGTEFSSGIGTNSGPPSPGLHFYGSFGIKSYGSVDYDELLKSFRQSIESTLSEQFLSDAKASIMNKNLRRAVLEMAIACEIFVKGAFFHSNELTSSVFDYLESKRKVEVSVIELLHNAAKYSLGESFKAQEPSHYKNIDFLFRARNKVAHMGKCEYRDDKGVICELYEELLVDWWNSIEKMMSWLNNNLQKATTI
jgi:hypothetical protein